MQTQFKVIFRPCLSQTGAKLTFDLMFCVFTWFGVCSCVALVCLLAVANRGAGAEVGCSGGSIREA